MHIREINHLEIDTTQSAYQKTIHFNFDFVEHTKVK
jgi:hypothetical protein